MALVRQLKTAGFMPKSRYNTFVDRPPTCQHSWHVKKFVQQYKLASPFGAKSILKIDYCDATFTSTASAKV